MSAPKHSTRLTLVSAAIGLTISGQAFAAGFQIIEHGAAGLGRAFAGEAAIHDDPSVIAHNPAGIGFIDRPMLTAAVMYIDPNVDVNGKYNFANPLFTPPELTKDDDDVATSAWIPAAYFNLPIGKIWNFGLGAFSDFGLITNYDNDFAGVLQADKSKLKTFNANVLFAINPHPMISLGAGISVVYGDVELSSRFTDGTMFTYPPNVPVPPEFRTQNLTGVGFFRADEADDTALGFNLGIMFKPNKDFTLGASFRSETSLGFNGDVRFFKESNDITGAVYPFQKRDAYAKLDTPEMWELAFNWDTSEKWAFHGSARWTRWTSFQELILEIEGDPVIVFGQPINKLEVKQDWNNAWRLALGITHDLTEQWTLRGGFAYDDSPVKPKFRNLRIPDNDRWWLSFGFSYKTASKSWKHDAGFSFIWNDTAGITDPLEEEIRFGQYDGRVKSGNVFILGYQLNYQF